MHAVDPYTKSLDFANHKTRKEFDTNSTPTTPNTPENVYAFWLQHFETQLKELLSETR